MCLAGPRVVAVAVSHRSFTPTVHMGSVVVILNGTSSRGRGSPLTRVFAGSKPLLSRSTTLLLVQLTDSYPRRVPAADTKEVVRLFGALLRARASLSMSVH
ncbi:hypothetical protein BDR04DRAFT_5161 [Suillus decipiens]|nr:hypothetical protein BDR04DRAFT_5161 [Suillus decipiens]